MRAAGIGAAGGTWVAHVSQFVLTNNMIPPRFSSLLVCGLALLLAACADHSGASPRIVSDMPKPPVNRGDDQTFAPVDPSRPNDPPRTQPMAPDRMKPNEPGGNPAPEPGTMLLVGSGLAGVALYYRTRRRAQTKTES